MASTDSPGKKRARVSAGNSEIVALLGEPKNVWSFFSEMSKIPRKSGNEAGVLAFLREFAAKRNLECESDAAGNTVIRRPGSGGGEAAPIVVLQNHVDMVCVKGVNSSHDFSADAIQYILDGGWGGDWLTADDTTLGSDNGVGACMALAILDMPSEAALPPVEALFTVDEETGLTGVQKLDASIVRGRTLLNLDTEQWGEICVGCAGNGTSEISLPLQRASAGEPQGFSVMDIEVGGLLGGHSGSDIKSDRANAIKLLVQCVMQAQQAIPELALVSLSGGDLRNSIPKHARAKVLVPTEARLSAEVDAMCKVFTSEYGTLEQGLFVRCSTAPDVSKTQALEPSSQKRLLQLLTCLPHGVQKYSHAIPGLPETSTNLAVVAEVEDGSRALITTTTRSSLPSALERVRTQMANIAELCGGSMLAKPAYSGWQPNMDSPIFKLTKEVYQEVLGREPVVKASHAGLECGVLTGLLPGLDTCSVGPEIRGAHSVDERVQTSTVKPCYDLVLKLLQRLSQKQ